MTSSKSRYLVALAFLGPALLSVFLLRLWPAALAVVNSFEIPGGGYGIDNYTFIFTDEEFLNSLKITAIYSIIINPLQIAIALALAILMNAGMRTIGFWRTIILLPVAIPQSVSAVVWGVALRPDGLVNSLLNSLGFESQRFLTSPDQSLASIMLIVSWIGVGYWMTFLVAGLQEIPKSLYEAVKIDGANRWQQFRYITLPQLRRPLTFVLVANTVANFLVFAPVQIFDTGRPNGFHKPDHERDLFAGLCS
ncbi:sugar ABC transporter permease [Ochrobactrum haematophilum]|uniref:Sugar ABC transporter permease n=1 Tax=Brucella haematophila TaxID=419474 RepID=A0ABX1DR87_9HYPH|nr:sugar ABC transporter permease [Brucella haematophila]